MSLTIKFMSTLGMTELSSQETADRLVEKIGIGKVISELKKSEINAAYTEALVNKAVYALINSSYYDETITAFRMGGVVDHAFCHYVNYGEYPPDNVLETASDIDIRLIELLRHSSKKISNLKIPSWHHEFDLIYSCMQSVFDTRELLKNMSPSQIGMALPQLKEMGFTDIRLPEGVRPYPNIYFREISGEDRRPIYNVLKWLHGPIMAQQKMDDSCWIIGEEIPVYITTEDLMELTKIDPVAFIEQKMSVNDKVYEDLFRWTVEAYRNEGKLSEIDSHFKRKEIRKLFTRKLISFDDMVHMPNTQKWYKRKRIESDLGL